MARVAESGRRLARRPGRSARRLKRWAQSRSLLARAIAASLLLTVLVAGTFVLMLVAVSNLRGSTNAQAQSRAITGATLGLEQTVDELEVSLRAFIVSGDDRFLDSWSQSRQHLPAAIGGLEQLLSNQPHQSRQAAQLSGLIRSYVDDYGSPLITIFHVQASAARAPVATNEGVFRINAIRMQFDRLLASEAALASADTATASRMAVHAVEIGVAALAGAGALLALYGVFLARGIAAPVRTVVTGASRVAAGDLSIRLPEHGAAEIHALTSAFNAMARSLEQGKRALEVQNEELRQSERLKSQLVSIVSHELRNPLTSILGYTRLLLRRDFEKAEVTRYLEIIQQQGARLASLLDTFLDSESVAAGRVEIDLQPLDLRPMLVDEAKLIADKVVSHTIEVAIAPAELPVRGDRDRLAQVFANLLGNAVKYSPDGGRVEVGGEIDGTIVRVHVRDEGIGVPEEHQGQIFTKFFRGAARESGIAGTGLGLAVSREIIEAHGGRISFTSRAGVGSHFWFELPIDRTVARPDAEADAPAHDAAAQRVSQFEQPLPSLERAATLAEVRLLHQTDPPTPGGATKSRSRRPRSTGTRSP